MQIAAQDIKSVKTSDGKTLYHKTVGVAQACATAFPVSLGQQDNPDYKKHIKFNHLYIVIDDYTYKYLFDSLEFFNDFARITESKVNAGSESWTGKYVIGYNNYLEIFCPKGFEGGKLGNVGFGFMPNKMGTLDSLYSYWKAEMDSVVLINRVFVDENGKSHSWFRAISIPDKDSLPINIWLMENTKENMLFAGFTENELSNEIDYWDYSRHFAANSSQTPLDSVKYGKLFDKVTSLNLTLSDKELSFLRLYLLSFGFSEKAKTFSKDDFQINYLISNSHHYIVNQIDFSLLGTLPCEKYTFRNIELSVKGDKASLKLKYK